MTENHGGPQQTTPETCDRCIARAAFIAIFPAGGELLFCGHHLRIHRERLLSHGSLVWPLPGHATLRPVSDAA
ncbi:DUF7455 domain-containing protein [Actinomycetospora sp.]|jgi:hypothetical protein|uniref:DUF7455 domain-containing protein n=1 Tax=Actinomycetospora sp. TaxID=1872135 RepID=UPI003BB88920